ncbi:MAG: right-handed parallel beta-helix repeat-containing protein [Myxococcales bacterium]|nr:right-handed parallel beta-helix repeat-containing protein [Myxococcales bacterium]
MSHSPQPRWLAVVAGLSAILVTGCPSPDPKSQSSTSASVSTSKAPAPVLPATPPVPAKPTDCTHRGKGRDFAVGPGQKLAQLEDVPFESLKAGDTVRIHYRPEPYRSKLMIGGQGTADQPIRICGVAGPEGQLPVIDGKDAVTKRGLEFPYDGHQPRGLVVVGHRHDEPWLFQPQHFVIEGLELRNASHELSFTDNKGEKRQYSRNAAAIYVQRADHVTIRGCDVHANQTALFIGGGGGPEVTHHVRILENHIHDNGSATDFYEHNVYNEAVDVLYERNWLESPRGGPQGVLGANIKERSAGVVIRYNWIEDGSHLLDLVDAQEAKHDTRQLPEFHTTYVYGNVFVRRGPSGSMIHYGGDSEQYEDYRKGTLFFFNNTVVVFNRGYPDYARTEVFELSTNDEKLVSFNNVYWSAVAPTAERPIVLLGSRDGLTAGRGSFDHDWIAQGWQPADARPDIRVTAEVKGVEAATRGDEPGFENAEAGDFAPTASSPLRGGGRPPPAELPAAHHLAQRYVKHRQSAPRADAGKTIGALE